MKTAPLSLLELNALVRQTLEQGMPDTYWVSVELSEVHPNANGHCYIECVQKNERATGLVAKARAVIWRNVYALLKPYFEQATGQAFTAGIKVLVQVSVVFHELYGFSLTVHDIDPSYTLGDMARRRREILAQLEQEGVLNLNKELLMPVLPQRVAVISAATAAGYGDFCNQLNNNPHGFSFYIQLFAAVMQGDNVEQSVLAALDQIYSCEEKFDVVVIIRGGGATSDLSGFDTYGLAAAVAQFPLPIITGIGHERDDTLIDMVSHTRVKTPTAAAEFLIDTINTAANRVAVAADRLQLGAARQLQREHMRLTALQTRLPLAARQLVQQRQVRLGHLHDSLCRASKALVERQVARLRLLEQRVTDASPQKQLQRGYSYTTLHGKVLKNASVLRAGDEIVTCLASGKITSVVERVEVGEPKQLPKF